MTATTDELKNTVRAVLAGYRAPKRVHVVETTPKSSVDRILRRALRDPLWRDDNG